MVFSMSVTLFWMFSKVPKWRPLRMFLSLGKRTICLLSRKQISIDLIFDLLIRAFFGRGELTVCHSLFCLLVSGSYYKIHDTCDHTIKEILIIGYSVKKIKTLIFFDCNKHVEDHTSWRLPALLPKVGTMYPWCLAAQWDNINVWKK